MELVKRHRTDGERDEEARPQTAIFGLRYLEEEEAEIYDVVGCLRNVSCTDDGDRPIIVFA